MHLKKKFMDQSIWIKGNFPYFSIIKYVVFNYSDNVHASGMQGVAGYVYM